LVSLLTLLCQNNAVINIENLIELSKQFVKLLCQRIDFFSKQKTKLLMTQFEDCMKIIEIGVNLKF